MRRSPHDSARSIKTLSSPPPDRDHEDQAPWKILLPVENDSQQEKVAPPGVASSCVNSRVPDHRRCEEWAGPNPVGTLIVYPGRLCTVPLRQNPAAEHGYFRVTICSSADFNQVLFVDTVIVVHKITMSLDRTRGIAAFKANDLPGFGF